MNRRLVPLTAGLALITVQCFAREPQAPPSPFSQDTGVKAGTVRPDPGITGEGWVDYVGHFGEVFKLRGGEEIDAFMSGGAEVINLHSTFRPHRPGDDWVRFRTNPSDFEPEKFTRLEMTQLIIIPRSSDAFRSLADLKEAKLRDLKASGVTFKVYDHPHFPAFRGDWPAGSFEIAVLAPYLLDQLYTATSSFTCILTSGIDTPPSSVISSYYGPLRYELAAWVVPQERPAPDESPSALIAGGMSFEPRPFIWLAWALITGLGCLLAGGLKLAGRWSAVRRVSLAVVIFSNAGAVLGGALGLICWPFAWFTHHLPIPAGIACLLMPPLALLAGRIRGTRPRRRAMVGISLWTLAAAAFIGYYGSYDWGAVTRYLLGYNMIVGFIFYAIGGIIYGALDSPGKNRAAKKALLTVLVFLAVASMFPGPARAQSADAAARAVLAKHGKTELSYTEDARKNLKKTRVIYDLQRVEVKGILSQKGGDNDTNKFFGPLFDLQIAPTLPSRRRLNRGRLRPRKTGTTMRAMITPPNAPSPNMTRTARRSDS